MSTMDHVNWEKWNDNFASASVPLRIILSEGKPLLEISGEGATFHIRYEENPDQQPSSQTRVASHEILLAPAITPRVAERFRELDQAFADGRGNCYINRPNLYIDVRGRTTAGNSQVSSSRRRRGTASLFTPQRAQVSAALITTPELLRAPIRELASAACTSVATAHKTLSLLVDSGYLEGEPAFYRFANVRGLIDAWVHSYAGGLGARRELFRGSGDTELFKQGPPLGWISGEPAVSTEILGGQSAHFYVENPAEMARIVKGARLRADPQGNVVIRSSFWSPRTRNTSALTQSTWSWPVAPAIVVLADLRSVGDPRVSEIAGELETRIAGDLGGSDDI